MLDVCCGLRLDCRGIAGTRLSGNGGASSAPNAAVQGTSDYLVEARDLATAQRFAKMFVRNSEKVALTGPGGPSIVLCGDRCEGDSPHGRRASQSSLSFNIRFITAFVRLLSSSLASLTGIRRTALWLFFGAIGRRDQVRAACCSGARSISSGVSERSYGSANKLALFRRGFR